MCSSPTFTTERAIRTNRSNSYGPIPCRRVDWVNACNRLISTVDKTSVSLFALIQCVCGLRAPSVPTTGFSCGPSLVRVRASSWHWHQQRPVELLGQFGYVCSVFSLPRSAEEEAPTASATRHFSRPFVCVNSFSQGLVFCLSTAARYFIFVYVLCGISAAAWLLIALSLQSASDRVAPPVWLTHWYWANGAGFLLLMAIVGISLATLSASS